MRKFNKNHFAIIRNYIELNKELMISLFGYEEADLIELYYSESHRVDVSDKKFLALSSISNDVLTRLYVHKKFNNTLNDFFERIENQIYCFEMPPELSVIYDFMGRQYEENAIFTVDYAIAEYNELNRNNELWKLFEDESSTEIFMPINQENGQQNG